MSDKYFNYGQEELDYLKSKDKKLAEVIDKIGHIERAIIPDLFSALVNSIIGQQISNKAHLTIWKRAQEALVEITPKNVLARSDNELQSLGLSFRKVTYIQNIAHAVQSKELDLVKLRTLSDEEVCNELSKLKGVGKWTAEMIMIFSMQRTDILSYGDLAVVKGMRMLYHHRDISEEKFRKYHRRYSPYASIASFYFWAICSGAIPEMKDYAPIKKKSKH